MMQSDTFERGWELQQAGDLRQAEELYRRLLRAEPRSARVWFALGQLCETGQRLSEAVACFRQAAEEELRQLAARKPRPGTVWIEVSAGGVLHKVKIPRINNHLQGEPAEPGHTMTLVGEVE